MNTIQFTNVCSRPWEMITMDSHAQMTRNTILCANSSSRIGNRLNVINSVAEYTELSGNTNQAVHGVKIDP